MRRRAAGEGSMEKRRDAKGRGREKSCCSFEFCPNEGGGGEVPVQFLAPFYMCIFGQ